MIVSRFVVSSPRYTKMNSPLKSDSAFDQLYTCQINFNLSSNLCDVLLPNQNWSDANGLSVAVENEGEIVVGFDTTLVCLKE